LLWAQRVLVMTDPPAHKLLDVPATAPADVVSDAFQKIARVNHPDLHRGGLTPEELESVTAAYGRVANAYQEMRSGRAAKAKPVNKDEVQSIVAQRLSGNIKAQKPTAGAAPAAPTSGVAATSMNSKALIHYRKAELALRRGDLRTGVLSMKMAIAADPGSTFLRSALAEIEAEAAKKP
jgi:hypothetical protein